MVEQATCKGCGGCCTQTLSITGSEEVLIKHYIAINDIQPHQLFPDACPFLTIDKTCGIYPVRPMVCRSFFCEKPDSLEVFQRWARMSLLNMVNLVDRFDAPTFDD